MVFVSLVMVSAKQTSHRQLPIWHGQHSYRRQVRRLNGRSVLLIKTSDWLTERESKRHDGTSHFYQYTIDEDAMDEMIEYRERVTPDYALYPSHLVR